VLCSGVFDILHYGHIRHLEYAKEHGARLIVGLTVDAHVNKGPGRPYFTDMMRMHVLDSLKIVDEVFFCRNSLEALAMRRPDVYAKGWEYRDKLLKEEVEFCKDQGIEIVFTSGTPVYSSTAILNYFNRGPDIR